MGLLCKKKTCMEREIYEQPELLGNMVTSYIKDGINVDVPENVEHVVIVASGSSYHCARFGADLLGEIANVDARAIYSSEFILKKVIPACANTLYVFITQSGETTDTNAALVRAKEAGMKTLCITNKENSTIWNAADYKMSCMAGEEKSIAATKSLTAQIMCMALLTLKLAQQKGINVDEMINELGGITEFVNGVIEQRPKIKQVARFLSKYKSVVIAGEGITYGLAKEAALKTKETSYVNTTPAMIGEFMHGHVAVFNHKLAFVYILADEISYLAKKNITSIKEDYNPPICILGNKNDDIKSTFNLGVDCNNKLLKYFGITVMVQLMALEIALKLHRNVDEPHGLHKVVK